MTRYLISACLLVDIKRFFYENKPTTFAVQIHRTRPYIFVVLLTNKHINTLNMDRTCDKCSKHIPHGSAYVCIAHNVEQMETDMITLDDTVTVISSDELLILCGQCGNAFNAKAMKESEAHMVHKLKAVDEREVFVGHYSGTIDTEHGTKSVLALTEALDQGKVTDGSTKPEDSPPMTPG